ncbi:MAG: hypothetical protein HY898_29895 [Deltaproteobacteria bacterium]|nr:hypothetical protein [Deltaproteobacteria bacterium]
MRTILLLLIACSVVGCSDKLPERPKLCLIRADAMGTADPSTVTCGDRGAISVSEGEVFFVRHELPSGIEPPGPVHIRVETACAGVAEEYDIAYGDGNAAIAPRVAPRGAGCAMTVAATIANSSLRETTIPAADACAKLVCESPEAGAD